MPLLIKICGVTTAEDAAMAVEAGAGAIGVNLWAGSKRHVGPEAARSVLDAVAPGVLKVGVFVHAGAAAIARGVDGLGLDRAELHGGEEAAEYATLDARRLIKAVR